MIQIRVYEHPLIAVEPRYFEVENLPVWLLEHYGETPEFKIQIFVGEPSGETEITEDIGRILRSDEAEYTVLQSPAGFDPFSWTAMLIYAVVIAVAVVALTPKPVMPGNINRTQQSPNNALANRENQVRLLERVEDIYGTVKSIPSLMMPTYNKYIGHKKFEYGYYCVGRGYYTISELRDGDTLISDINGASAAIYDPFKSPNSGDAPVMQIGDAIIDDILTASRAIEVDGITLKAANQVQLPASAVYTFTPGVTGGTITQATKQPNFNACVAVGDSLVSTMSPVTEIRTGGVDYDGVPTTVVAMSVTASTRTYSDIYGIGLFSTIGVGDTIVVTGFGNPGNNGAFVVATKANNFTITVASGSQVNESAYSCTLSVTRNYASTYVVEAVNDGSVKLTLASSGFWTSELASVTCSIQVLGASEYTDWVTLPDTDRTEVWINVTAPNGMFKDNNGKSAATVAFTIEVEKLNGALVPLGVIETFTGSLTGSVSEERAETVEHMTAWTGPARVRMHRTTLYDYAFGGTVMDEVKWNDLYSISPITKTEFGNKTTIQTVTQATARATAVKSRQLNCLASRLLPTFDGLNFSGAFDADGRLATGTIHATSQIVDIIGAVSLDPKIGARDLATEVDLTQMWGVQGALWSWSPSSINFNYTLDSDALSYEETLVLIANAAFCVAYRQNGKLRLSADLPQTSSSALFGHRNKKPNSETITRRFASDADYDGVEFTYVDPISNQSETIRLPVDGSASKYKKYEIAGIRDFTQAWYRANREYAKLIGQRISIDTVATMDARSLLPNARIDVVDNTRFTAYDGEVIGQSGYELTLSQAVAFTSGSTHFIILMKRDGSLQSIQCTAGSATNKVVLASLPVEAVVTSPSADGIRTIFSFAATSTVGKNKFDILTVTYGYYCHPVWGTMTANPTYCVSDYIAVIPGSTWIVSPSRFVTFFTAAKVATSPGIDPPSGAFVVPAGAYYMRITTTPGQLSTFQAELGSTATAYEAYTFSGLPVQSYLVQEIDITDNQYVNIKAINYSADYYAADSLTVPDRASIIY